MSKPDFRAIALDIMPNAPGAMQNMIAELLEKGYNLAQAETKETHDKLADAIDRLNNILASLNLWQVPYNPPTYTTPIIPGTPVAPFGPNWGGVANNQGSSTQQ